MYTACTLSSSGLLQKRFILGSWGRKGSAITPKKVYVKERKRDRGQAEQRNRQRGRDTQRETRKRDRQTRRDREKERQRESKLLLSLLSLCFLA